MKKVLPLLVLLALAAPARGSGMELRSIMKDLDATTQSIAGGINRGDFEAVANDARKISDHEEPSFTEKIRILAFLLTNAKDFKSFGDVVHDESVLLAEAARKNDYDGAITHFSAMLKGCAGCHARYRKKFVEHFYK